MDLWRRRADPLSMAWSFSYGYLAFFSVCRYAPGGFLCSSRQQLFSLVDFVCSFLFLQNTHTHTTCLSLSLSLFVFFSFLFFCFFSSIVLVLRRILMLSACTQEIDRGFASSEASTKKPGSCLMCLFEPISCNELRGHKGNGKRC